MNKTHYIRNVKKPELVNMYLKLLESDDKKRIKELESQNKELNIKNANLNNDIKLQKDTSVDRGEYQRLEGFLKKKDHVIEDLKKQIDSTKINALAVLENEMAYLKKNRSADRELIKSLREKNKELNEKLNQRYATLKEDNPQSRFDMIRVLSDDIKKVVKENEDLSKANQGLKAENIQLKKDIETIKGERGEIIQKLDKIQNGITLLYDDF